MYSQSKHGESVETMKEKESYIFQYICTICASFAVAGCGCFTSWTSAAFEYYKSPESNITVTKWQTAWINSIIFIGVIFGCVVVPFIIDRIGRKKVYLLFCLFQILGWILIIFAPSYLIICIARFCQGFAESALFDFISVYIAEIAEKRIRGKLGTMLKVAAFIGVFYTGLLGALVSYQTTNLMCLLMPLLFLLTFPFMPESPYFCLMKGRDEEAERILMKLRGVKKPDSVNVYTKSIKASIEENKQIKRNPVWELMSSEVSRKCLLISFLAKGTKMLSGTGAMAGYTQFILVASGFELEAKYSAVIIYGFLIIASLTAVCFVDKVDRRTLFLVTGIICSVALASLGLFFFFKDQTNVNVSSVSWVPMASLILFYFSYCSGIGPISYIISGELFSINVKGVAVNLGIIFENLCGFVVGLEFHHMNDMFGKHGTFWIFGLMAILGSVTVFCVLPETRGKSLEEIQAELQGKKKQINVNMCL